MCQITSLREKIAEEYDYPLFDEVIKCLESKAYRSAYIMIWIGIAESLLFKLKKMGNRDAQVGEKLKSIDEIRKSNNSIDAALLDYTKELGIINYEGFKRLTLIKDMRNAYAHPSGVSPSIDEVTCALNTSVELVLSQHPLLGHGYVNQYLDTILNDTHFYKDSQEVVEKYANEFVLRVRPNVLEYSFGKTLRHLEEIITNDEDRVLEKRGFIFASVILKELFDDSQFIISEDDLNQLFNNYPLSCCLLFVEVDIYPLLFHQVQNRAFNHIINPLNPGNSIYKEKGLIKIHDLMLNELLTETEKDSFRELIISLNYGDFLDLDMPLSFFVEKIINDLKSYNYYKQNDAVNALRNKGPLECGSLNEEYQEQLGRNILQSADGGARSARYLLSYLKNVEWPYKLISGLLLEIFVDDNLQFRLKAQLFKKVVNIVINHSQKQEIFEELNRSISQSVPKNNIKEFEIALSVIEKAYYENYQEPELKKTFAVIENRNFICCLIDHSASNLNT